VLPPGLKGIPQDLENGAQNMTKGQYFFFAERVNILVHIWKDKQVLSMVLQCMSQNSLTSKRETEKLGRQ
jgi:hypothetical protein